MRVETMSTSIPLLLLVFVGGSLEATTVDPSTLPPAPSTVAIPKSTVAPPTTTTTSTKKPEITTTMNPNIKLIEEGPRNKFVANSNGHRDKHQMGRYAFVWTWDPTLVDSAISRVIGSCDPKIDNSDEVHELSLNQEDWKLILRDRKTLNGQMKEVTYLSGIARVGCVQRINCQNSTLGQTFIFCHFGTSNFTKDADFKTGKLGKCEHDGTYSSLCQDVPDKAPEYVTADPARIVYRYRSSAALKVLFVMVTVLLVHGVIRSD